MSTMIEVEVPQKVEAHARRRAAGDLAAPPPVLMLEDLAVDPRQALQIQVVALRTEGSSAVEQVLATTNTVASPTEEASPPFPVMTLAVPLNNAANALLVGRKSIALRLDVVMGPNRPLQYKRVYFDEGGS